METLPKDLILYLALKLDLKSLKNFCLISKKYNVSRNKIFWRNKLDIERPKLLSFMSSLSLRFKSYRELYINLEKTKNLYNIFYDLNNFEIFGVTRGKISERRHHKLEITEDIRVGNTAWVFISTEGINTEREIRYRPKLFKSKKSVIKYAEDIICSICNNNEEPDLYLEKIKKEKYIEMYNLYKIFIKKVTIF